MTATESPAGGRRGGRVAIATAVVAAIVVVVLTTRATPRQPFDVGSPTPNGWGALAELVELNGGTVRTSAASALVRDDLGGSDTVVVVARPSRLTTQEREALDDAVVAGSTVVLGAPEVLPDSLELGGLDDRTLADTEDRPMAPGECTMDELAGLGPIDAAFVVEQPVPVDARSCYGTARSALVVVEDVGEGRLVTLADPLLWSNARLQPAKETGGQPLDNAAMALRLILPGEGVEVVAIDPTPSPGATTAGGRDPLELLPVPVKLALLQGAVALVLYLWWRGRRLGRPVTERLPVRIAASELVEAVGDLLRRRGSAARAAATMRADLRRELSGRLGVPPGSPPEVLVEQVATRTGRPGDAVRAVLWDPSPPRREDLATLAAQLDSIRQEVLDDQPVR